MSKLRELLILHVMPEELRLAAARLEGGCALLSQIAGFPCTSKEPDAAAVRDQAVLDAVQQHISQRRWHGRDLVCVVSGPSVASQYYELPPLAGKALDQAVRLKLGPQLHFDINQSIVALGQPTAARRASDKGIRVPATAIQKEVASSVVQIARQSRLNLVALVAGPAVVAQMARRSAGDAAEWEALLLLDERGATLVAHDASRTILSAELPISLSDLTAAYMRPIISGDVVVQLDAAAALALRTEAGIPTPDQVIQRLELTGDRLLPLLEPVLQKATKQLTQWLTFASTCNKGAAVRRLALVGPSIQIPGLAEALASRLSIEVEARRWLAGWVQLTGEQAVEASAEEFALLAGAAVFATDVPDLRPPEYRRERRLQQVRRVVAVTGPLAACAMLAFGSLFGSLDSSLASTVNRGKSQWTGVQQILGENDKRGAVYQRVRAMESQLAVFAESTPGWIAVFKELSLMLPAELRVLEYSVRQDAQGMKLLIRAGVHPAQAGRGFDEVVSHTLLLLQRSALFRRVELVSANKGTVSEDPGAAGSLAIEVDLMYPHAKEKS